MTSHHFEESITGWTELNCVVGVDLRSAILGPKRTIWYFAKIFPGHLLLFYVLQSYALLSPKTSSYGPYFCITALRLFVPYIAWMNIKECQGIYISLYVPSNHTLTCFGKWKPLASVPWVLVYTSLFPVGSTWSCFMQNLIRDCILAGLLSFPYPPYFHSLASFPRKHSRS